MRSAPQFHGVTMERAFLGRSTMSDSRFYIVDMSEADCSV